LIWIDYAIIGLISISALIGLSRGFVREFFSIAAWVAAIWIGLSFSRDLSHYLRTLIEHPAGRMAAAFAVLIVLTLIVGGLVGYLLRQLIDKTGLSGSDRFAGFVFGIGRGMVVVAMLVLLAGLTPLPNDLWWRESTLITPFQSLALWLRDQAPAGMAGWVAYR
jgi:membrane protein required for colicin V production